MSDARPPKRRSSCELSKWRVWRSGIGIAGASSGDRSSGFGVPQSSCVMMSRRWRTTPRGKCGPLRSARKGALSMPGSRRAALRSRTFCLRQLTRRALWRHRKRRRTAAISVPEPKGTVSTSHSCAIGDRLRHKRMRPRPSRPIPPYPSLTYDRSFRSSAAEQQRPASAIAFSSCERLRDCRYRPSARAATVFWVCRRSLSFLLFVIYCAKGCHAVHSVSILCLKRRALQESDGDLEARRVSRLQ